MEAVGLVTVGAALVSVLPVVTGAAEPVTGRRVLATAVATGTNELMARAGAVGVVVADGALGAAGSDGAVDAVGVVDAVGAAGAAGASVLVTVDTTGVTGSAEAGVTEAGEAASPRAGTAADGCLGALGAWAGALAGVPELAPDELVAGEVVLVEPVPAEVRLVEVGVDVDDAEPTAEVTGDVAELTADVAEPRVDEAEPRVDEGPEMVDVRVALRGDTAAVAAWAGRENSSMTTKMPAVASAACIATRATRRAVGCMSSSHSTTDQVARLPSGGGANLAHTELLFGHHRTV
jgi:hypothetical protein